MVAGRHGSHDLPPDSCTTTATRRETTAITIDRLSSAIVPASIPLDVEEPRFEFETQKRSRRWNFDIHMGRKRGELCN